jgi:hypothetical protein
MHSDQEIGPVLNTEPAVDAVEIRLNCAFGDAEFVPNFTVAPALENQSHDSTLTGSEAGERIGQFGFGDLEIESPMKEAVIDPSPATGHFVQAVDEDVRSRGLEDDSIDAETQRFEQPHVIETGGEKHDLASVAAAAERTHNVKATLPPHPHVQDQDVRSCCRQDFKSGVGALHRCRNNIF